VRAGTGPDRTGTAKARAHGQSPIAGASRSRAEVCEYSSIPTACKMMPSRPGLFHGYASNRDGAPVCLEGGEIDFDWKALEVRRAPVPFTYVVDPT